MSIHWQSNLLPYMSAQPTEMPANHKFNMITQKPHLQEHKEMQVQVFKIIT